MLGRVGTSLAGEILGSALLLTVIPLSESFLSRDFTCKKQRGFPWIGFTFPPSSKVSWFVKVMPHRN